MQINPEQQQQIEDTRLAIVDGISPDNFRKKIQSFTKDQLSELSTSIGNKLLIDFKEKIATSNGVNIQNLNVQEILLKLQETELGKKLKEYKEIVRTETHKELEALSKDLAISAPKQSTETPKPGEAPAPLKPEAPKTAKEKTDEALGKGAGFFKDKVIGPLAEKIKDVPVIGAALEWLQKLSVDDITYGIKRAWYALLASPSLLGVNQNTPIFGGLIGKISTDAEKNILTLDLQKYARESGVANVKVKEGCTDLQLKQAKEIREKEGADALKIRTQKFLEGRSENTELALKDILTPAEEMAKQAEVSKQEQEVQKLKGRIVTLTNGVNIDVKIGTPEQMEWSDNGKATITLPADVTDARIQELTQMMKCNKLPRVSKLLLRSEELPMQYPTVQYTSGTLTLNALPETLTRITTVWNSAISEFVSVAEIGERRVFVGGKWVKPGALPIKAS